MKTSVRPGGAERSRFWRQAIHMHLEFLLPKCYKQHLLAETPNTPQWLCEGNTSDAEQNRT